MSAGLIHRSGDLPFDEIGKWKHHHTSNYVSVSNIDERIHPMIEGSFCDDIHEGIAYLSKNHENVRLETQVIFETGPHGFENNFLKNRVVSVIYHKEERIGIDIGGDVEEDLILVACCLVSCSMLLYVV